MSAAPVNPSITAADTHEPRVDHARYLLTPTGYQPECDSLAILESLVGSTATPSDKHIHVLARKLAQSRHGEVFITSPESPDLSDALKMRSCIIDSLGCKEFMLHADAWTAEGVVATMYREIGFLRRMFMHYEENSTRVLIIEGINSFALQVLSVALNLELTFLLWHEYGRQEVTSGLLELNRTFREMMVRTD